MPEPYMRQRLELGLTGMFGAERGVLKTISLRLALQPVRWEDPYRVIIKLPELGMNLRAVLACKRPIHSA